MAVENAATSPGEESMGGAPGVPQQSTALWKENSPKAVMIYRAPTTLIWTQGGQQPIAIQAYASAKDRSSRQIEIQWQLEPTW